MQGVATPAALKVKDLLARQWVIVPEPPLSDPDADLLWEAEQAAQRIHALAESPDVKQFFERRVIATGLSDNARVEVVRGLKAGDEVALEDPTLPNDKKKDDNDD